MKEPLINTARFISCCFWSQDVDYFDNNSYLIGIFRKLSERSRGTEISVWYLQSRPTETFMPILVIIFGRKCTLVASCAALWWVTLSIRRAPY